MRSRDRGKTWEKISPDLSRVNPELPKTLDPVTAKDIDQPMKDRFGVVYTISPSPLDAKLVWVGTDDGLIQVTRDDGKNWQNVTPPSLTAWSKVSQVEAGHFDKETAYASVDRHRLADDKPYIYRTHDGGKTWQNHRHRHSRGRVRQFGEGRPRVKRPALRRHRAARLCLLQRRQPVVSAAEQHAGHVGARHRRPRRGPRRRHLRPRLLGARPDDSLRQIAAKGAEIAKAGAYLFAPGESIAVHNGGQNGTPLPHEEPQEQNPPAGVVAYYWLGAAAAQPLKIELVDSNGKVRSCLASDTPVKPVDTEAINVQAVWEQPCAGSAPSAAAA
jgi:hypothetical protein